MRFSLLGFPVRVHPSHFLFAALLGWPRELGPDGLLRLAIWVAVVFVSVLWHELGHAVAMRRYGAEPSIELHAFGGLTRWQTVREPPGPKARALTALAGPLAGMAVGAALLGVLYGLRPEPTSAAGLLLTNLVWVNVGWGVLNLLPILPLDGGLVLEAVLDHFTDDQGRRPALMISLGLAVLVTGAALAVGWWWPAMLTAWFAVGAFQALRMGADKDPDDALAPILEAGWRALKSGDLAAARAASGDLLAKAQGTPMRTQALELRAWVMLAEGKAEGAASVLDAVPAGERVSRLLEANIAAGRGMPGQAARLLEEELAEAPSSKVLRALLDAEIADGQAPRAARRVMDRTDPLVDRFTAAFAAARLFGAGEYAHARDVSSSSFEAFRHPEDAYNAACACARLDEDDNALVWLERAVKAGFADRAHFENDEDLARLRAREGFDVLLAAMDANVPLPDSRRGAEALRSREPA